MTTLCSKPPRNPKKRGAIARRSLAITALGIVLIAQLSASAHGSSRNAAIGHTWFGDPIVGTWNVLVDITNCESGDTIASGGQALALFNADGTRHETNATNPALRTPAYGNWTRVHDNVYEFAVKFFRFDAAGAHIGSTSVRHELFLYADGKSYFSEGIAEFFGPANNPMFVACSSATATRYE